MTPTIGHDSDGRAVTIDPERLISTRMLVQANSGGGKSWMLRVLCERLGKTTPLIVLDREGEFASLRERLDVLLVGREGEIPTAVATAGALASQILEIGVSAVIDLYDLSPTEKRAYVRRFLESLMAAPKRLWSPRIVVVDEAHDFCPESGDAESAEAVCSLTSAGRKRQFCAVLATQRLSKLAKDAAAELNNTLIGRCTLDVDQKRAADVLGMSKTDWPMLRDLDPGQFFAFGPAFNFKGVQAVKSVDVQTTHGHKAGAASKPPEPSARMSKAVAQLKDLAERAKTEVLDLDHARTTIKDLRRQLAAASKAETGRLAATVAPVDTKAIAERAEREARAALKKALAPFVRQFASAGERISRSLKTLGDDQQSITAGLGSMATLLESPMAPPKIVLPVRREPSPKPLPKVHSNGDGKHDLNAAQRRVLNSLAWLHGIGHENPSQKAVGAIAGIDTSGGYWSNVVGPLSVGGLLERANGRMRLLPEGQALAESGDIPADLDGYHRMMVARVERDFGSPSAKILRFVIERGTDPIPNADIGEACGVDVTGGYYSNIIGPLSRIGLVERSKGMVTATSILFPEGLV